MTQARTTNATKEPQPSAHTLAAYQGIDAINENDLLEAALRVCMKMAPGFTAFLAAKVDDEVRPVWAKDCVYVPTAIGGANQLADQRNAAIMRDHDKGERPPLLARRYQLSERRIRQIIAQMQG